MNDLLGGEGRRVSSIWARTPKQAGGLD